MATVRADFIRLAEEAALPPFTHPSGAAARRWRCMSCAVVPHPSPLACGVSVLRDTGVHLTTEEWNPANGLLNLHWKKVRLRSCAPPPLPLPMAHVPCVV